MRESERVPVWCGNGYFQTMEECLEFAMDGFCDYVRVKDLTTASLSRFTSTGRSSSMWWKVWGDHEKDYIIVRADTFDEAIRKGRQYDQQFDGGQVFDPSWDIERLKMEPDIKH